MRMSQHLDMNLVTLLALSIGNDLLSELAPQYGMSIIINVVSAVGQQFLIRYTCMVRVNILYGIIP
jgi:hypothetical protein